MTKTGAENPPFLVDAEMKFVKIMQKELLQTVLEILIPTHPKPTYEQINHKADSGRFPPKSKARSMPIDKEIVQKIENFPNKLKIVINHFGNFIDIFPLAKDLKEKISWRLEGYSKKVEKKWKNYVACHEKILDYGNCRHD